MVLRRDDLTKLTLNTVTAALEEGPGALRP